MRWTLCIALTAAAAVAFTSAPADAQTRRSYGVDVQKKRERTSTRITVRRARSYLDPGTEVLPGSRSYTDYAMPPMYRPNDAWDPARSYRFPLPGGATGPELPGFGY
ncbi:MAG: hypothetical protein QOD74_2621 [Variibacter sp.]|jgi:hypothetical protein|nr:hypothetical protein [Variibacter sp.]